MANREIPHSSLAALRPVRVTIPTKVAFDLQAMQKITASVLGRLGCPSCHSGFDLRWDIEEQFHVGPNLELREVMGERIG